MSKEHQEIFEGMAAHYIQNKKDKNGKHVMLTKDEQETIHLIMTMFDREENETN